MSRSFSYNPDYIIPVIHMRFIQNPFEKQCITLDPSWTPPQPLHDTLFTYDFDFEKEVLTKSTQQLQDVIASEPCSNLEVDELVIPIENLITSTNIAPSTLEPIPNGNISLVNIEDFDSHNTDPFQEAELKTINDMEELQTVFLNPPQPQVTEGGETSEKETTAPITCMQDTPQENPSESEIDVSVPKENEDDTIPSANHSIEEIPPGSKKLYMNLSAFPSASDTSDQHSDSMSPKPPVPAPRKLKGNSSCTPNSPTPIPRLSAPKIALATRPLGADISSSPRFTHSDVLPTLPDASIIGRNSNFVLPIEAPLSDSNVGPAPPPYVDAVKQDYPCPESSLELVPSNIHPPSQFQANHAGLFVNLTDSLLRDINAQVDITSAQEFRGSYLNQSASPLSEEEQFYGKISGMGFSLDSVKKISESFNTKDEGQVVEHLLAIQNVSEMNKWEVPLAETAYVFVKGEIDDIKAYIETFLKYREMGFPDEQIHFALEKCGKEHEKMLEILFGSS